MKYHHLTPDERYLIYILSQVGISRVKIAKELDRSPSTISREMSRNKGGRGYRPKQAQESMNNVGFHVV